MLTVSGSVLRTRQPFRLSPRASKWDVSTINPILDAQAKAQDDEAHQREFGAGIQVG